MPSLSAEEWYALTIALSVIAGTLEEVWVLFTGVGAGFAGAGFAGAEGAVVVVLLFPEVDWGPSVATLPSYIWTLTTVGSSWATTPAQTPFTTTKSL